MARCDWILHGIDEAGYGPRLGPLVQACASLRETAPTAIDFEDWEAVLQALQATGAWLTAAAAAQGQSVGDSKALYGAARRSARGTRAAHMEPGSAAMATAVAGAEEAELLAGSQAGAAALWQALLTVGGPGVSDASAGCWPDWLRVEEEPHPAGEHPSAGLATEVLTAAGANGLEAAAVAAGRLAVHAICLFPRQFNAWAQVQNKAEINWELTRRLVRARLPAADAPGKVPTPTVWTLDRQGGRKRYGERLSRLFAPADVQVVMETAPLCVYRVRGAAVNGWVTVKVDGEAWSVGTALASMAAKALREAAMARLNAHFLRQYPRLAPTAGYPQDAERWRAALVALDRAGVPDWEHLWRCK